jgi:hypothetical protein
VAQDGGLTLMGFSAGWKERSRLVNLAQLSGRFMMFGRLRGCLSGLGFSRKAAEGRGVDGGSDFWSGEESGCQVGRFGISGAGEGRAGGGWGALKSDCFLISPDWHMREWIRAWQRVPSNELVLSRKGPTKCEPGPAPPPGRLGCA